MTGLVRKAAVLAVCGVLFGAAVAYAGVPSPVNSTIPARINLVGVDAGTSLADSLPAGAKVTVTVRDLANAPIPNSSVVIDFTGDLSDTRIGDTQVYQGLTANCGTHGISALTDAAGVATFVVVGGGKNPAGAAHPASAGTVYADGVNLGPINVGFYDMDGVGGVALPDLSRWSADYFGATNPERADYDNIGGVQLPDLSLWAGMYFAGKSNLSAATYCP
jgi:hypothetical protein